MASLFELPPNPEQAKTIAWERAQKVIREAHDSADAEAQIVAKLGLPGPGLEKKQLDRLIDSLWQVFRDKRGATRRAEEFLTSQEKRHPNPLSPAERKHLAAYMGATAHMQFSMLCNGHLSVIYEGKHQRSSYSPGDNQLVSVPDVFPPFLSPRPNQYDSRWNHYTWNRGTDMYQDTTLGLHPRQILDRRARQGNFSVLDEGRGDAFFLNEVKRRYGDTVTTFGVGMINVRFTDRPVDVDYIGPAELLPARWSNQVDLAFSLQAYRYFLYPERALSETLRVLKPNGEAFLDIPRAQESSVIDMLAQYFRAVGIKGDAGEFIDKQFAHLGSPADIEATVLRLAAEQGLSVSVECASNPGQISSRLHITKHA